MLHNKINSYFLCLNFTFICIALFTTHMVSKQHVTINQPEDSDCVKGKK